MGRTERRVRMSVRPLLLLLLTLGITTAFDVTAKESWRRDHKDSSPSVSHSDDNLYSRCTLNIVKHFILVLSQVPNRFSV